jgi:hypothetical protein
MEGNIMAKDSKHRKNEKKKPQMTLKERRAKKHEKHDKRIEHLTDEVRSDEF